MVKRIRIGLNYNYSNNWIGGLLYAQNLLKALNLMGDMDKPYIDVYCRNEVAYEQLKLATNYPYLNMVVIDDNRMMLLIYRKLVGILFGKKAKSKVDLFKILPEDEVVYPLGFGSNYNKLVYWQPDFQYKHLPELFTKKQLKSRDSTIRMISERNIPIVFSSYDSENDFRKFYPEYNNKTFVVHFAVDHSNTNEASIDAIRVKYGIRGKYILCANQFWKHKNHLFLFRAFLRTIKRGLDWQLVCTGRLSDYRNKDYIDEIMDYLRQNVSDNSIILTDLVDIGVLQCLMSNAYAVVQPSLFEGWNTTVEDCKSLNKFIFLSNLSVHQEQINKNVCFFDPYDEEDLVDKLITVVPIVEPFDYNDALRMFGEKFMEVIKYVIRRNCGELE